MPPYLLTVPTAGLLLLAVSPFAGRAYDACQHPFVRQPAAEAGRNVLLAATMCLFFVVLYASTGGSMSLMESALRANAIAVRDGTTVAAAVATPASLHAGAAVGAIMFTVARVWALTRTQSFAQSLYFTGFLGVVAFLAAQLVLGGVWTKVTDDIWKGGTDDLTFLAFAGLYTSTAIVVSEAAVWIMDFAALRSAIIPYSLVREQLESAELYERARGPQRIKEAVTREIVELSSAQATTFHVDWLSGNAAPDLFEEMRTALDRLPSSCTRLFRVVCNDDASGANRRALGLYRGTAARFIKSFGHFRIIIIDDRVALVGIQLGFGRQPYWPDYGLIIREPLRVAVLKGIFDQCWQTAQP